MQTMIQKALNTTIDNWEKMKESREEHAEEDANQFEASFYELMEQIRRWIHQMPARPKSLDEALLLPELEEVVAILPPELYLNFETELELIIEGETRMEDAKYD